MSTYKYCRQIVHVRDIRRYTGRGAGGFELHYRRERCKRHVKAADDYCWQHRPAEARREAQQEGEGCGT